MKKLMVVMGVVIAAAACSRVESDQNAQRAAAEVRDVAARAGDQLADSWLTTKIQAQYFADDDIKARYINVTTHDGLVTLKGRVDDNNARVQAVQIATNTDGVRQVVDQLMVGPAPTAGEIAEQKNAAWITTQIQARYFADPGIRGRDIGVAANGGVVTLSGRVEDAQEKERALSIARNTDGVTRVDDRLAVQPSSSSVAVATTGTAPIDDAKVTSSIQAKYYLDNLVKGRRIDVATRQGVVTLHGEVASDNERAQALLLARTTEGVDRVEDALTVNPSLGGDVSSAPVPQAPIVAPQAQSQDASLAKGIQDKFAADAQLKTGSIEVTAKDGVVLLDGTAPNNAAKQRALTIARGADGVIQVVDRIRVGRAR